MVQYWCCLGVSRPIGPLISSWTWGFRWDKNTPGVAGKSLQPISGFSLEVPWGYPRRVYSGRPYQKNGMGTLKVHLNKRYVNNILTLCDIYIYNTIIYICMYMWIDYIYSCTNQPYDDTLWDIPIHGLCLETCGNICVFLAHDKPWDTLIHWLFRLFSMNLSIS